MKMTRCQEGFSFIEIMISLSIMAIIVGYISTKVNNARKIANDTIATVAIRDIADMVPVCWNHLYQYPGAVIDHAAMKLNCFKEGNGKKKSEEKTLLTLPEGMVVMIDATDSKLNSLGGYHTEGTKSSSGDPTVFCLGGNGELITTTDTRNCPML